MQQAMFNREAASAADDDSVANVLRTFAQSLLVVFFGLIPVLFVPVAIAPFAYSKVLLIVFGITIALIFFALATLRNGTLQLQVPLALWGLWGVAFVTMLASLFSGDISDAFLGDQLGIHTGAFMLLLATIASAVTILKSSKMSMIRLYSLITVSALILGVFHFVRLLFGVEIFSFGIFTGQTSSLIGGWNDVALFFGLTILLALVAVEQLPLTKWGKVILGILTSVALVMLTVVNFFAVWLVLAVVSLVMLMYSLTKHRFKEASLGVEKPVESSMGIVLAAVVFVFSVLFIIGGSALGGAVSDATGISYVEVRPSFTATLDIAGSVYQDNAFLGIGPNKFSDAWRLYKDPAINQTIFWNTDFESGNGFITTSLVSTGVFGALAWLIFFGLLLWHGVTMLFRPGHNDRFWYFVGTSSTVASIYLWGMALMYVPTAATLILTAVCTGIMMTAYGILVPGRTLRFSMWQNRHIGFAMVMVVIIVIVASVSVMYFSGRHYAASYAFNAARASIAEGATLESVEQGVANAFAISQNDRFAREIAEYQFARLTSLLSLAEATELQQQQFQEAISNGANAARLAISSDPGEARNWQVLGQIYSVLIPTGIEGAYDQAIEAYKQAALLDPLNPLVLLLQAQAESRAGNLDTARLTAESAVALKRDYTEALLFLSQLDIAEGNVEQAISRTESIVALEPRNPARLYQLGVLYSAGDNLNGAIAAFREAVRLDPNYANARYLLALGLVEQGDNEAAISELRIVSELNPQNTEITTLITALENGEVLANPVVEVSDPVSVIDTGEVVTTTTDPETSLVSPVNTVPAQSSEETTVSNE